MNRHRSGLELLEADMARQHVDAMDSFQSNAEIAGHTAKSIAHNGKLLLVGMGASHYANRIAEPCYRKLGIEAWACTAADLIQSPLPPAARTTILVSQSGESGEILELLNRKPGESSFGMTLDPSSALGRSLGAGGVEIAFAATRGLSVTLASRRRAFRTRQRRRRNRQPANPGRAAGRRCAECADRQDRDRHQRLRPAARPRRSQCAHADGTRANAGLRLRVRTVPPRTAGTARAVDRRHPAAWLRSRRRGASNLARTTIDAGSTPVIFDCSGEGPVAGAVTVDFPPRQGGAALTMLPSLQRLIVGIAAKKVERVGEPIRSAKITRATS